MYIIYFDYENYPDWDESMADFVFCMDGEEKSLIPASFADSDAFKFSSLLETREYLDILKKDLYYSHLVPHIVEFNKKNMSNKKMGIKEKRGRKSQYPNGSRQVFIFIPCDTDTAPLEKIALDQVDRVLDVFRLENHKKYSKNILTQTELFK